jgi:hypothetical protein
MASRDDDAGTVLDRQHLDRIDPGGSAVNCKTMQNSDLFTSSGLGATPSSFPTSHNEKFRPGPGARCLSSSWMGVSAIGYFSDGPNRFR